MEEVNTNLDKVDRSIKEAKKIQAEIGFPQLAKGFISHLWIEAQEQHIKLKKEYQQSEWGHIIVKAILEYSYRVWKHWKEEIHGTSLKEGREKQLTLAKEEVRMLFDKFEKVKLEDKTERDIFSDGLDKVLQKGLISMDMWIQLAKKVLEDKDMVNYNSEEERWMNRLKEYDD